MQVPVAIPPKALVTPVNLIRPQIQPMQPITQPMMRPSVYSAATYRPTMRRNDVNTMMNSGFTGYRPVNAPITNMNAPHKYTTRTYKPRRL